MEASLASFKRPICGVCRSSLARMAQGQRPLTASLRQPRASSTQASPHSSPIVHRQIPSRVSAQVATPPKPSRPLQSRSPSNEAPTEADLKVVAELCNAVLSHSLIPSEEETLAALKAVEQTAQKIAGLQHVERKPSTANDDTPASALLSLDARTGSTAAQYQSAEMIDFLSALAYRLITHPSVFISPSILKTYVSVQALLVRPSSLPQVFTLYAMKPLPSLSKDNLSVTYAPQSPTAVSTAIPTDVAHLALTTALQHHSLPLALSIISTTYATPSFHRSKLFRRALPPIIAASLAPLAAYSLASSVSTLQTGLSPESFTSIAFAGLLTYTTAVGTIGYVALTTSNDQMERVTWAVGLPLWERWVREEERSAMDRVVKAWGFREKWRWGEEEGAEWDGLKEWAGVRGMVVDKVGLMEGME